MLNPKYVVIIIILIVIIAGAGMYWFVNKTETDQNTPPENISENPQVVLETNKGDIKLEIFENKAPITAGNFLKLAREGLYDGTKFHRIIPGFVIQGGDPNSKTDDKSLYGQGGPGYTIEDEFVDALSNVRGTISMANTGQPNSGGSQFFINLSDNVGLDYDKEPLASKHPVFGMVISGMEVVDEIAKTKTGQGNIPVEDVVIEKVVFK